MYEENKMNKQLFNNYLSKNTLWWKYSIECEKYIFMIIKI